MTKSLYHPMEIEETGRRFMSREDCDKFFREVDSLVRGGGTTKITVDSNWNANVRWARNHITTSGDTRDTEIEVTRNIRGARWWSKSNSTDSKIVERCIRRAEKHLLLQNESLYKAPSRPYSELPHSNPKIWFDSVYSMDDSIRSRHSENAITLTEESGLVSAGYLAVKATGAAVRTTNNIFRYYPYTLAQFSITVRDTKTYASGWAGVDFNDWERINYEELTHRALEKCIQSRNPVAIEPGRYETILEAQAVSDLFSPILDSFMGRVPAEQGAGPFAAGNGNSKIGLQVIDSRITVSADPMDPDCGFVPFDWNGEPYIPVKWIENGVLRELEYNRHYGITRLTEDYALPNSKAYRMSGGDLSVEEMVSRVKRGILVTRLNGVMVVDQRSLLSTGNTRDGLWLIEDGVISKAVRNFRFTDSPLFAFNNVSMLGIPQRVFRPSAPAVVPPVTVRDFSFTSLMDAI